MKNKRFYYILIPLILLCLWQVISSLKLISPLFVASPYDVFAHLVNSLADGSMVGDIVSTLYRVLVGYGFGVVIGLPLGLLMG